MLFVYILKFLCHTRINIPYQISDDVRVVLQSHDEVFANETRTAYPSVHSISPTM